MFSPRWRKILRDLWGNKTRTLLVVLSIAVGVFAVGMIVSTQMILSADLSNSYRQTNPAHAFFYGRFDDESVEVVRRMPGVRAAEGRGSLGVQLISGPESTRDLQLTTIADFDAIQISKISRISGAWPPADKEILIERASLEVAGLSVGDSVTVELGDRTRKELRVVGVAHDLGQPSATFNPTLQGYITRDTQEWLGAGRNFREIQIVVGGSPSTESDVEPIAQSVRDKLDRGGTFVGWMWIPRPNEHWADEIMQSMLFILGVLGFLALGLSGFLVINTISALLTQQVRQIGVMKTIGARTGQLVEMYMGAVIIFGLLSLLVAVPLGAWAAHELVNFTAGLLNFYYIPFRIPPAALALEIAAGLIVPIIAALWPVFSGAQLTVREAIGDYGIGQDAFGSNPLDRLLERVRGLPRPMLLSLRNTFRRKGRLLLTLSTLILGGAIFIAVTTVQHSLLVTLDEALAYWDYDVLIELDRPYRIRQLEREALRVPEVVAVESWARTSARRVRPDDSESPSMRLLGPPPDTQMLNPRLLAGRWLVAGDENALVVNSMVLDDDPDIEVGSQLTLNIQDRESEWIVVGIVQGVLTGPIAYANEPFLSQELRSVGRGARLQVATREHDTASQQRAAAALADHLNRTGLTVASTRTTEELRVSIVNQFNIIIAFLAVMAVLIAVVGALGLMGTMSMNVLERSREIGVMRAIGASDGAVLRIFLVEGILIGAMSWVVGALLSLPISKLLSDVVGTSFIDAPLLYTFSTDGALLWLGLVLALAALSSLWPAWRATQITVRDVLAYE